MESVNRKTSRFAPKLLFAILTLTSTMIVPRHELIAQQEFVDVPFQPSNDLYAQAISAKLNAAFQDRGTQYVILGLRSHRILASHWDHREEAIPAGSLFKPFVALAYGKMLQASKTGAGATLAAFPVFECDGKSSGCWSTAGHGPITLERAIAESCNAYFLILAGAVADRGLVSLEQVVSDYQLPAPPETALKKVSQAGVGPVSSHNITLLKVASNDGRDNPESDSKSNRVDRPQDYATPALARTLIGLTPDWRIPPLDLATAYAKLVTRPPDAVARRILDGMQFASERGGTAVRVGVHPGGVLAKTGTAPCVEEVAGIRGTPQARCVASGDGLVILAAPAIQPRLLLLVRRRGTTGAMTAETAGMMLSLVQADYAFSR